MEHHLGTPSLLRCVAVGLGALALAVALAAAVLPDLASSVPLADELDGQPFDRLLVWLAELALLGGTWWLCLLAIVVSVGAARGVSPARGVPHWWRRWVLVACGVALLGSFAAPAHADPRPAPRPAPGILVGSPTPGRDSAATHVGRLVSLAASGSIRPAVETAEPASAVRIRRVDVRPGDSLWAIAQASLGADAPAARVAAAVRRIHAANASTIGEDPDLIFPGQRLWVTSSHPVREESS